jgi:DNA-binding transcriptional LysR family regulator
MLSFARLQALHEVARHGSLTRAAEALHLTTSAVSQQITLLERETRVQLVERHARGVRLTEPGRALVRHAEAVFTELRAAEASLDAIGRGEAGRLRFGSFPTANAMLMPTAVAAFRRRHAAVDLTLREVDSDDGLAQLAGHHLDLALTYEFPLVPAAVPPGVTISPLLEDPLFIVVARKHRLARRRRLRLTDLAEENWIQGVHHGSTTQVLPQACRHAGFEPRIAFRTDDQMTVRGLVSAGVGVALAPSLTLPTTPPGLVAITLDEPTLVRTVQVATSSAYRLPAAEAMIDELRRAGAALTRPAVE